MSHTGIRPANVGTGLVTSPLRQEFGRGRWADIEANVVFVAENA